MNTTAEQESLTYFARFMRLYPIIAPITREVAAELEAEGLDPTSPELERRVKERLNLQELKALID
ncbi:MULTISPECIES: hypothetical protein [Dermabacter]|uniref:Uncharacterized protein n=1 Tax=Dermabacter vaginalis TaxID=1630135 RepID=A0A1B0ZGC0_9MICO|nr:hypothetical protein [Dermabacter vaginalis]ANP26998.1 hypothetical protein DAD186_04430 [Dermabacter vaginalis]